MNGTGWRGLVTVGLLGVSATSSARSQEVDSRVRFAASVSGAILRKTSNRSHATLSLGGGLGMERRVTPWVATRLFVGVYRPVVRGNSVFVPCPPPETCSDAVFPDWLVVSELQGLVSVRRDHALKVLGGVGVAFPIGGRAPYLGAPRVDSTASPRATLRGGLELRLGGNSAPRVQLTRSAFTKAIFSLDWLDVLAVAIPF